MKLGEWDLAYEEEPLHHQMRGVRRAVLHPQHDPRSGRYDIALLLLQVRVDFFVVTTCTKKKTTRTTKRVSKHALRVVFFVVRVFFLLVRGVFFFCNACFFLYCVLFLMVVRVVFFYCSGRYDIALLLLLQVRVDCIRCFDFPKI